jgi:hypothetical protein
VVTPVTATCSFYCATVTIRGALKPAACWIGTAPIHLTLNGPFQLEVSGIFGAELARRHFHAGAVAVLSPDTGSVLASVSYPLPSTADRT